MGEKHARQLLRVVDVAVECGLARYALGFAIGAHPPIVDSLRQAPEASPVFAEAGGRAPFVDALQVAHGSKAQPLQPLLARLADAPQPADALRPEPRLGFFPPQQGEAARLV